MTESPQDIKVNRSERCVEVTWPDGARTRVSCRTLREACRCANCVHEFTGEPLLDKDSLPGDLEIVDARLVGKYAVHFTFSDGHDTGMYTWQNLRDLGDRA